MERHENLSGLAAEIWALVEQYLERTRQGSRSGEVGDPEQLIQLATAALEKTEPDLQKLLAPVFAHTRHLYAPSTLGHQVAPPLPFSGLMDGLVSSLNQGNAVYEMSPWGTAVERAMVRKLAGLLGWGPHGVATGGGTLANVTAILAARNRAFPESWRRGASAMAGARLLVPEDAHYSFSRAAGMIGIGTENLIPVPVDAERRMRGEALSRVLEDQRGQKILAVVATAGSTAAGAFDAFSEIAAITRAKGIWLHIDGCHGASVLLSDTLREKMQGAELGDSLSWDAHKLLWMPALSTFVLFRREEDAEQAFPRNTASYLFDPEAETDAKWDGARRTFECTKRSLAVPLWACWARYGQSFFADRLERVFQLATDFHREISETPGFVAGPSPQSNIVLFRFDRSPSEVLSDRNRFHRNLRRRLLKEGDFYITTADLAGETFLRVVWMEPDACLGVGKALLARLRSLADSL